MAIKNIITKKAVNEVRTVFLSIILLTPLVAFNVRSIIVHTDFSDFCSMNNVRNAGIC